MTPITVEATIAETKSGSDALKFISEVLDATKTDVDKTVSAEVLDRERADEAASALEKLLKEEETAFAALLNTQCRTRVREAAAAKQSAN